MLKKILIVSVLLIFLLLSSCELPLPTVSDTEKSSSALSSNTSNTLTAETSKESTSLQSENSKYTSSVSSKSTKSNSSSTVGASSTNNTSNSASSGSSSGSTSIISVPNHTFELLDPNFFNTSDYSSCINYEDDWFYFANRSIIKINIHNGQTIKISDDATFSLAVSQGWVYYIVGNPPNQYSGICRSIYKIRTDGTEKTLVASINSDSYIRNFKVRGNWVYLHLITNNSNYELRRVRTDGSQATFLYRSTNPLLFSIADKQVLLSSSNKLLSLNPDTLETTIILNNSIENLLYFKNGLIYYSLAPSGINSKVYTIKPDGSEIKTFIQSPLGYLNAIYNESAYYFIFDSKTNTLSLVCASEISGKKETVFTTDANEIYDLAVIGNKLYSAEAFYTGHIKFYSCDLDGKNRKLITTIQYQGNM